MNIAVCMESPSGRASRRALSFALRLGAEHPVTILCVGAQEPPAVRTSGAQRAVCVRDEALAAADHATRALVLAEGARHLHADLVLAGAASDDEGRGLVPAALAHQLHVPILAHAQSLALAAADEFAITLCSGGQRLRLGHKGPLVVTVAPHREEVPQTNDAAPPLAWEFLSLAQLGLDASRLLRRPNLLGELEQPARPEVLSVSALVARWLRK